MIVTIWKTTDYNWSRMKFLSPLFRIVFDPTVTFKLPEMANDMDAILSYEDRVDGRKNTVSWLVASFSPQYNKFCNPLGYVTFWVAISSNLSASSFIRDPALSQINFSTWLSFFNHENAPSMQSRFDLSSFHII